MAISKTVILGFLLVICRCAESEGIPGGDLPCIQKLLPCQQFLKGPLTSLPASCCVPLKQIVAEESACLCQVFNNEAILKAFNVTQDDALNLAHACGAHADKSLCQKAAAAPRSTPATAPTSANGSAPSPHPKSAATSMHHVGGSLVMAAILSFIFSAF